jgi:hypothetical protein
MPKEPPVEYPCANCGEVWPVSLTTERSKHLAQIPGPDRDCPNCGVYMSYAIWASLGGKYIAPEPVSAKEQAERAAQAERERQAERAAKAERAADAERARKAKLAAQEAERAAQAERLAKAEAKAEQAAQARRAAKAERARDAARAAQAEQAKRLDNGFRIVFGVILVAVAVWMWPSYGWINGWDFNDGSSTADWDCMAWRGWTIGSFEIKREGPWPVERRWC